MPLISTLGSAGIQAYGTAGIQPGGSALINAVGAGLSVPASGNFAYGTGNFTIEMWIYPFNYNEFANVLWAQTVNRPSYFLIFIQQNTGQISFQFNGSVRGTSGNAVTLNAWNHVAVVRNSGTVKIYVNGTGSGTASVADDISNTTFAPNIGRYTHAETIFSFNGYITNVRVAKSSIYTADFEPTRTPFTRTSQGATSVQLLLNHKTSSAFLTDSSANNLTVTNVGGLSSFSTLSPYTVPYVTPASVIISSATVTPNTVSVVEGQTITFTIAGTNTANGTYYYTIEQAEGAASITAADFTSASLSGSFTISGNSGSFPLTLSSDLATEGSESFVVFVRTGSITGPVLGSSAEITISDTSLTPAFTVTPASINEGSAGSFTVANVGPDGTYFFTVLNGTTANADFSAVSGSFIVSGSTGGIDNGTGSFNITTVADRATEGSQTFQVQVRSGSISGTVVVTSASVTVNDTSLLPFVNPQFLNIAELAGGSAGYPTTGTIQASNLGPAGTYYWTILNFNTTNADFSATSGSFTTSTLNGIGSFTVTAVSDTVLELNTPSEFQVEIRTGSTSGPVIGTSGFLRLWNSSLGVTVAPNPASEGNGLNITVFTSGSDNGLVTGQYWLTFIAGTASAADVSGLPFAFNVTSGGNYFINGVVSINSIDGAELSETFRIGVRQGNPTTGPLVGQSDLITINTSFT